MVGIEHTGAAVLKVLVERAAPKGFKIISSWLRGKEVLVVGQARAGKTTFIDYLHYGLFDEGEPEKTYQTTYSRKIFDIKVGRVSTLEVSVKKVTDVPGQAAAMQHADLAFKENPHAILIFTDLTTPAEGEPDRASASWLSEFCRHLDRKWSVSNQRHNRIKEIIVVMNKSDKVDSQVPSNRRMQFSKILDAELRSGSGRGDIIGDIAIMPCTLVSNPNGTREVDSIIAHLAKRLA